MTIPLTPDAVSSQEDLTPEPRLFQADGPWTEERVRRAACDLDAKIVSLAAGLVRIAAWRQAGLRVGFTNGCFDLLHPGHVRLLAAARAQCDRLVVGLNTDRSIKRLKGPERPIQDETARATVMAAIGAVDLVILFAADTPIDLITAIVPDVLIKGADYTVDTVVGADIVMRHGGKIALIPLEPGQSTTRIIARSRPAHPQASPDAAAWRAYLTSLADHWRQVGLTDGGHGVVERLDPLGQPLDLPYRRLTAHARQVFLFAKAGDLLARADFLAHGTRLLAALLTQFADHDRGGFFFKIDRHGAIIDESKDLYAHSFVLLALAEGARVLGCGDAHDRAIRLDRLLVEKLSLPEGGLTPRAAADWGGGVRCLEQNPHMHLLEAYLALESVNQDTYWAERADAMVRLFYDRLYDPILGCVGEYFTPDGRPDPINGDPLEPGHQYEWAFLLQTHAARRGLPLPDAVHRLHRFADRYRGDVGIVDQIDRTGTVLRATKRIWPVTECLRAKIALYRQTGDAAYRQEAQDWALFLWTHYLQAGGFWSEHLDAALTPIDRAMPATTPYHLIGAVEALLMGEAPVVQL